MNIQSNQNYLDTYNKSIKEIEEVYFIKGEQSYNKFKVSISSLVCKAYINLIAYKFLSSDEFVMYALFDMTAKQIKSVWFSSKHIIKILTNLKEETTLPLCPLIRQILDLGNFILLKNQNEPIYEQSIKENLFVGVKFETNTQAALGLFEKTYEFPLSITELEKAYKNQCTMVYNPLPDPDDFLATAGIGDLIISDALDQRPILATNGLADCIGVVGYEPNKKIGFIAHLLSDPETIQAVAHLFEMISSYIQNSNGSLSRIEVTLCGGLKGKSENLLTRIKEEIKRKNIVLKSDTHTLREHNDDLGSTAVLDTRTGEISFTSPPNFLFTCIWSHGKQVSDHFIKREWVRMDATNTKIRPVFIAYTPSISRGSFCQKLRNLINIEDINVDLTIVENWLNEILLKKSVVRKEDLIELIQFLNNLKDNRHFPSIFSAIWCLVASRQLDDLVISLKEIDPLDASDAKKKALIWSIETSNLKAFNWLYDEQGSQATNQALIVAINKENKEIIDKLINQQPDCINTYFESDDYPLLAAIRIQDWKLVEKLVKAVAVIYNGEEKLFASCQFFASYLDKQEKLKLESIISKYKK
jgi:hypothetical protein